MRAKQNGGLLLREKQARQLSTCLSKPLTAQRCSHKWTIEPWNYGMKNLKSLNNMVCCWLMPGSKNIFFKSDGLLCFYKICRIIFYRNISAPSGSHPCQMLISSSWIVFWDNLCVISTIPLVERKENGGTPWTARRPLTSMGSPGPSLINRRHFKCNNPAIFEVGSVFKPHS